MSLPPPRYKKNYIRLSFSHSLCCYVCQIDECPKVTSLHLGVSKADQVMICLSTLRNKKLLYIQSLWKNLIYARIIVRVINPGQFPSTQLFSRLKISIASLKARIWTFLSPSNFIFRKKSFSFLWSRNSQLQVLRTVGFLFLSELPSSKKTLLHPRPAAEPQSPNSSALQPALRLHFWLLYRPMNPPSGVLRLWGSEFWDFVLGCVCVYMCTLLCVLWCFLCSLYHLWVFSRSAVEPLTVSSRCCLCTSLQKWLQALPCLLQFGATTVMNRHEPLDTCTSPPRRGR